MRKSADVVAAVMCRAVPTVLVAVLAGWPSVAVAQGSAGLEAVVASAELLEGVPTGAGAQRLNVQGGLRAPTTTCAAGERVYAGLLRIDTGSADSIAPASELAQIGIVPVGVAEYRRADGTVEEYPFGLVQIEFLGEMKEGRILFGPEGAQPAIGLSALAAIGFAVDPETNALRRVTAEQ